MCGYVYLHIYIYIIKKKHKPVTFFLNEIIALYCSVLTLYQEKLNVHFLIVFLP